MIDLAEIRTSVLYSSALPSHHVPQGRRWRSDVARYGQAFEDGVVARVLPPQRAAADVLARWPGTTRNWTPTRPVARKRERVAVVTVQAARTGNHQPVAS